MTHSKEPIATLGVSRPRRVFALGMQLSLALLLIGVALTLPSPAPIAIQGILLLLGLLLLWKTTALFRATELTLILMEEGLTDSSGVELCKIDNIEGVDRGTFAFKPSNGFLIRLKEPLPRGWVPGLWWRVGKRIGIGGATSGKAARDMADVITLLKTEQGAELIAQARSNSDPS